MVQIGRIPPLVEDEWGFNVNDREAMRKNDEYVDKWRETLEVGQGQLKKSDEANENGKIFKLGKIPNLRAGSVTYP